MRYRRVRSHETFAIKWRNNGKVLVPAAIGLTHARLDAADCVNLACQLQ